MTITIITVTFNAGNALERTIQSVISQDYPDIEYIIIDGGSRDSTLNVIEKYKKSISYWISEPDEGIYDAMNKGINMASGAWVNFMNSGDCFINNHIVSYFASLMDDSLKCIYGNVIRCYNNHKERLYPIKKKSPDAADFILTGIDHQGAFIHKSLFQKYGLYDTRYRLAADSVFFMKTIGINREPCKYIDIDVALFMMNGASTLHHAEYMEEKGKAFEETFGIFKTYVLELAEYRKSRLIRTLLQIRLFVKRTGVGRRIKKLLNIKLI